jgi:predicted esterase
MVLGGTSLVTTLPAPTMAFSPTVIPHNKVAPDPIEAPRLITVGTQDQSFSVCKVPSALMARGNKSLIKVTLCQYKDAVFDGHTGADERVARNLAIVSNLGAGLYFNECADFCVIANFTTIQIDEVVNLYIFS